MAGQSQHDAILTEHPALQTVATGQATLGTTAATQLANVAASLVLLTAPATNTGLIYLGPSSVSSTTGLVLSPGTSTPLLPLDNLNRLYARASASSQTLTYLVLA